MYNFSVFLGILSGIQTNFFFFFLVGRIIVLQCVVVSAIQQPESVIIIHGPRVSLLPLIPPL